MKAQNNDLVILEPYQEKWAKTFQEEKKKLEHVFQELDISFYHIGSTSIPGCNAKPIIDILGVTADITQVDRYNEAMRLLHFEVMGEYGMMQRRLFRKREGTSVNLHIFEDEDPEIERHLRFCAYLKRHPEKIIEYSALKQELARQKLSRDDYTLKKDDFIKSITIAAAWEASSFLLPKKKRVRKKEWTLKEISKAFEVNFHLLHTYFSKYLPTMELIYEPDVSLVRSEIPDDCFNTAINAHFTPENVHDRIAHVISIFKKNKLPFNWYVSPYDTPPNLGELLLSNGFQLEAEAVAMYCTLDAFTPRSKSALRFERITKPEQMDDFAKLARIFQESPAALETIYRKIPPILYTHGAPLEYYIGYVDNSAVVIGSLIFHANVAGIYYIATLPAERQKGYGTAMVEHLMTLAKNRGYHMSTLESSNEAKDLYVRLGFKKCFKLTEYYKLT